MDITILSLDTLEAIKADALSMLRDPGCTTATVIEAREWIDAVDRECARRIEWARALRAALAMAD